MRKLSSALLLLILFTVPVFAFPQRIISTMPSITETLFALGLGGRVVGVTQNDDYPPEARTIEAVGRDTVNLEKVIYLKPDLVIMLEDAQKRDVDNLKKHGLPVMTVNPHSVGETMGSILEIGRACGATEEAERVVVGMKKALATMETDIFFRPRPSVLVVVGYKPLVVVGNQNFVNDVINLAGGRNSIAGARSPYPEINLEELYRIDPQYIVLPREPATKEQLLNDPVWSKLSAVKNDRILLIDPDILFRPGPRIVGAVGRINRFINK
ncbi:MAG TPA: cobalamin-binding protein [Candidatus Omnitrophota bacterium]|nr:cobalamin-binding protein [Candidatus Omnitrophota bacterium]